MDAKVERVEVLLEPLHQARRHLHEDAVAQFAVHERARVQGHRAVLEKGLDLGGDQIVLDVKVAHVELVLRRTAPLLAARKVDRREHQNRLLPAAHVDLPSLLADLEDTADDDIADLSNVTRAKRPHRDELIDALDHAGDRRY